MTDADKIVQAMILFARVSGFNAENQLCAIKEIYPVHTQDSYEVEIQNMLERIRGLRGQRRNRSHDTNEVAYLR